MLRRRLSALLVVLLIASVASASPSRATGTAPRSIALLALNSGQEDHLGLAAAQYSYVVVQQNRHDLVPAIQSSGAKAYMYLNAGSTKVRSDCAAPYYPYDETTYAFGVDYCWAWHYHPDWFLSLRTCTISASAACTYTYTTPAQYSDYAFAAMDMGNPGYQQWWGDDAVYAARAYAEHFDGVYLDDVNTHPGHGLDQTATQSLWSSRQGAISDEMYGDDVVSFIANVGDKLAANQLTSIANVAINPWNYPPYTTELAQVDAMAPHLTAVNKEFFSQWYADAPPADPDNRECGPFRKMSVVEIQAMQAYAKRVQSDGTGFTSLDYLATTWRSQRSLTIMSFSRASFLLSWNGNPASASLIRPCGDVAAADPHWTTELGLPTGATRTLGQLLIRTFADGVVIQNQGTTPCTVTLDGSYTDQDGVTWTRTTPVTLAGASSGTGTGSTPGTAKLLTKNTAMSSPPPTLSGTCQ